MSKVLIVCYSYTGASRRLAQMLACTTGWPQGEVLETFPRAGASGTWRCVLDSLLHRRPPVRYDGPPLTDFDAVVLVSPIWVGRLAGPMRSFLAWQRESLRDVVVVSTMGGQGAPAAVAEVSRLLGHAPLLDAAFTTDEINDGSCRTKLQSFGTAVQAAEDQRMSISAAPLASQTA